MRLARASSLPFATILATGIFLVDTLSSLQFAVASLYAVVILVAANDLRREGVVITGIACASLTVLSYILVHGISADGTAPLRSVTSLIAVLVTTVLLLRNLAANERVKEVERERANLARFFSPSIVDQLIKVEAPFSLARRQSAAVLFVDVVGFTNFSSDKSPDVVIRVLRTLLRIFSDAVFSHHGSIDKFLGDGLMASFGLPMTNFRDATNAAECALEMVRSVDRCNQHCDTGDPGFRIAVGIHYGEVVQGDVGNERQLELTVIGDTVNVASRVEAYCRALNVSVLVTSEFMNALSAEGSVELAKAFSDEGPHILRGRKEPIRLFSIRNEPHSAGKFIRLPVHRDQVAGEAR
jgi:class 3 adenylate cyclase